VVPLERCVEALRTIDYRGGVSIEHEPDDYDPTAEIAAARGMIEGWLAGAAA
jgi:L-ribulose-5-phosphate 3-epimerase